MQDLDNRYHSNNQKSGPVRQSGRNKWWYLLLLIPLAGLIYPPLYAHKSPVLGGIPFFIWYQFAWIFGGIATTLIVSKFTD